MSIKDKVAVIGMGCTKFGEHWDLSEDHMIVDAAYEAFADAGIEPKDIQAAWLGMQYSFFGCLPLARSIKFQYIPITKIENDSVTGVDAFRNACIAVAAGVYDVVLAVGCEKMKDLGVRGMPDYPQGLGEPHIHGKGNTPPDLYALTALRYFDKYNVTKETLARITVKNRRNGAKNPRAFFQQEVTAEEVLNSPEIASPLSRLDCCPVTDGAAAAVICRADLAKNFRDDYMLVKGIGLSVSGGKPQSKPGFDFLGFPATAGAAKQAYAQAGINDPVKELDLAIVQDCFTIGELVSYEDLGFCPKGKAKEYLENGTFNPEGDLPVNTDGGALSFGHPPGATGLRGIYEVYKQLQRKVEPSRQLPRAGTGLVHTLAGEYANVSGVVILGHP